MAGKIVGIIDFNGQAHCMDHASTVSSYEKEILTTSGNTSCWCGVELGRRKPVPGPTAGFIRMTDGIKGERTPPRRLIAKGR